MRMVEGSVWFCFCPHLRLQQGWGGVPSSTQAWWSLSACSSLGPPRLRPLSSWLLIFSSSAAIPLF